VPKSKIRPPSVDELGGCTEGGENQTVLDRLSRYSKARNRALVQTQYLESIRSSSDFLERGELDRLLSYLKECGNYLVFNHYYTVDELRLTKAHFCKRHLLCPLCAVRRAAKAVKVYLERYEYLKSQNPRLQAYMMTLTVKNGDNLEERYQHLKDSLSRLMERRRDYLKKGWGRSELSKCLAGVYSCEFTKSPRWGWHPHVHMVVLCEPDNLPAFDPSKPKNSPLSREWAQVTKDSFIVDFRPITGVDGFTEVFKYALKFSTLAPDETWHAFSVLKARRLIGSFGDFRGVQIPEELTDDLIEDLPYIELFYRYFPGSGYSLQYTDHCMDAKEFSTEEPCLH
jgi:plasmid rolling circle replication initiator protein Rep